MAKRNIVVIGASAGGFNVIKKITAGLPADFPASVFIVWHLSPDVRGILPDVINRFNRMVAAHAKDKEQIKEGRIYIAPPDHHMIIDQDRIRITRGPKENRFRPAIDPLFRSAALHYGQRVVGLIFSGALDDGSAGLWTIKRFGGIAIVQDPAEAEVRSMPEHALRAVEVDYKISVDEVPALLERLVKEEITGSNGQPGEKVPTSEKEIQIAMGDDAVQHDSPELGQLTPFTCPECHGVLNSIKEGNRVRFRCHTGHAFSADTLLAALSENIEESLWNGIRTLQESVMLLNHLGDHFAERNHPKLAALYFQKAKDSAQRAGIVRSAVMDHEQLSQEGIEQQSKESENQISSRY